MDDGKLIAKQVDRQFELTTCYDVIQKNFGGHPYKRVKPEYVQRMSFLSAEVNLLRALCVGCNLPAEQFVESVLSYEVTRAFVESNNVPFALRYLFSELLYEVYIEKLHIKSQISREHLLHRWSFGPLAHKP